MEKGTNYYYLYNQTTREKNRRNINNDDLLISGPKCIYDIGIKKNYSKSPTSEAYHKNELYERKSRVNTFDRRKNKFFYNSINLNDIPLKNKRELKNKNSKNIINNIKPSSFVNKKEKYQRCNSMAYIKKRPNDLIKNKFSENTMNNRLLRNSFKMKGRCLSCH